MSKKILFVSHEATQSGAPLALLDTIKWLKNNTDWEMDLLLLRGGVLKDEFFSTFRKVKGTDFSLFTNLLLQSKENILKQGFLKKNTKLILRKIALMKIEMEIKDNYDLIYGNSSVTSEAILEITRNRKSKIIIHIHELHNFIVLLEQDASLRKLISICDKIIAVSKKCNSDIIKNYEIDERLIELVYPCREYNQSINEYKNIREFHKIPDNAFLVGFCGYPNFIKGIDLVPSIALQTINKEKIRPIHFLWLGENNSKIVKNIEIKCRQAGLSKRIHFVGQKNNAADYFKSYDIFALTSRTESFSMACLENAKIGNPIICFDGASGAQEYINNESGRIVPFEDAGAMAEAILDFYNNPDLLRQAKIKIQENVRHITFENSACHIKSIIEKQLYSNT